MQAGELFYSPPRSGASATSSLSPTAATGASKTTTTAAAAAVAASVDAAPILKIAINDVVVDLAAAIPHQQNQKAAGAASAAHQMMYVDVAWRHKKFRTTATARSGTGGAVGTGNASTGSSTAASFSAGSGSATAASASAGASKAELSKLALSNRGPLTETGDADVMVVTLRRCEIFGDADQQIAAFRLADVPWIKDTPILVRCGAFLVSLTPLDFGDELPPEYTLAERLDAVPPVDVVFSTGESAREKKVPWPPLESSQRRKAAAAGRGKQRPGTSAGGGGGGEPASHPLFDGTATQASSLLNKKLDGRDDDADDNDDGDRSSVGQNQSSIKSGSPAPSPNKNRPIQDQQRQHQQEEEEVQCKVSVPQDVRQVIDAQVPPDLPLVSRLGLEMEMANITPSFPAAINASSAALAEAVKRDLLAKLASMVRQSPIDDKSDAATVTALLPYTGGRTLAERVAAASSRSEQPPLEPLPIVIEVQNIQLLLPPSSLSSTSASAHQQRHQPHPTLVLDLAVRCARTAPPCLVAFILNLLASHHPHWSPSDVETTSMLLATAIAQQQLEDKNTTTSVSDDASKHEALQQQQQQQQLAQVTFHFTSVSCNKVEPGTRLQDPTEQVALWAEQKRILAALEQRPLEIILNESGGPFLRWRGCVPDVRCASPAIVYRRKRSARDALVACALLPVVQQAPRQDEGGGLGGIGGFFRSVARGVSDTAEKASQKFDQELRLFVDFPELKEKQQHQHQQQHHTIPIVVADTWECDCINGSGIPAKGRLYLTGMHLLFHSKEGGLHIQASLANDIICIRRVSSFGSEAFQVLIRGGTALQFSGFDGFFARLSMAVGFRSFTKFFDAINLLVDLWHAQRSPVCFGKLDGE